MWQRQTQRQRDWLTDWETGYDAVCIHNLQMRHWLMVLFWPNCSSQGQVARPQSVLYSNCTHSPLMMNLWRTCFPCVCPRWQTVLKAESPRMSDESWVKFKSKAMQWRGNMGELKKLVWNYCHCHTIIVTGVIYSIQIRFGYRFRYSQSDSYIQSHTVVVGLQLTVCDMLCL